jgi:hypothetical protein
VGNGSIPACYHAAAFPTLPLAKVALVFPPPNEERNRVPRPCKRGCRKCLSAAPGAPRMPPQLGLILATQRSRCEAAESASRTAIKASVEEARHVTEGGPSQTLRLLPMLI